jgi:hypothetical protein
MAIDGYVLCSSKNCRRVLFLGKHKNGRFWPAKITESQFAEGIARFITEHFAHGTLSIMCDGTFEKYLDACPIPERPITVLIESDDAGRVSLVDQEWSKWA